MRIAMKITTSAMMMYMALFTSRELTVRRLSAADMGRNSQVNKH